MGVGFDRSPLLRTDHRPGLLDVDFKPVGRPEQLLQEPTHMQGQLTVQPLKGLQSIHLFQTGTTQQITGEVVAVAELRMGKQLTVKGDQLGVHRRSHAGLGSQIHLQHRCREKPVEPNCKS